LFRLEERRHCYLVGKSLMILLSWRSWILRLLILSFSPLILVSPSRNWLSPGPNVPILAFWIVPVIRDFRFPSRILPPTSLRK
jgi:hypothetical protein